MNRHLARRTTFTLILSALALGGSSARALVSLNDGHDKVFVTGTLGFSWDSNIDANALGGSDVITTAGVLAEYVRHAGMLGIDASLGATQYLFGSHNQNNSINPSARLEISKSAGRTTGSLALFARRDNQTDSSANKRALSWNYGADLALNYPVIERYSLAGDFGYDYRDFKGGSNLVDVRSATAGANLFYMLDSQRDLFGGYRYRHDITTGTSRYDDHDFHLGLKGRILPKLIGTVSGGYQHRESLSGPQEKFDSWSASATATWSIDKKTSLTGMLTKDFRTTAIDLPSDTEGASLRLARTLNSRWNLAADLGVGHIRYLGRRSDGRTDTYLSAGVALEYSMNDHFKASLGYNYLENWSSLSFADYKRNSISLSLRSRW
jgi:hypothetical protein